MNSTNVTEKKFNIKYGGSLFWLIFWFIVFFPVALVLFFTNFSYYSDRDLHEIVYEGSRFWLAFWTLVFFPVAIVLGILNGVTLRVRHTY